MFLKVNFRDNDFCTVVEEACENIMLEISSGYKGKEVFKRYEEYKGRHGIENIRKSIVLASYGHLIARQALRLYDKTEYDFSRQEHDIKYLDENITLEEVEDLDEDDNNCEVCYINLYLAEVCIF